MKHDPSILILFFISFDLAYFSYELYKFSVLLLLLNSPIRFSNIIYSIFFLSLLILFGHWVNRLCCCCCYYYCFSFSFLMWANKNLNLNWISEFITSFMFVTIFRFFFFCKFPSNFVIILILLLGQQQQQTDTIDFHHMHFLSISNGKKKNSLKWEKNSVLNIFCIFNFVLLCLFVWKYTFVEEKIN